MNYANEAGRPMTTAREVAEKLSDMNAAKREKTWDECGIEEKVERIRRELLHARELAQAAYRNAGEANALATRHQHSASGEVLRPADRLGGLVGTEGRGFDPLR